MITQDEEIIPMPEERYLSLQYVERILMVSRWTLYRWLKNGQLRGRKIGRQYRIPMSELRRILGQEGQQFDGFDE